MVQGRQSKVKEFGIEAEVIELLRRGQGPKVISDLLNKRHPEFPIPLNHVNIISFREGLAPEVWKAMEMERVEEFYIKPVEKLRGEMELLRESAFPALLTAIERGDVKKVRILSKTFMDTWDRVARLEEVINPTGEMKAKVVHIQQQFNVMKDRLSDVFGRLCPDCRNIVMSWGKEMAGPLVIDVRNEPEGIKIENEGP